MPYIGYSMSENAHNAYVSGKMPLSKWTKSEILDRCGEKAGMLSKLTVAELRNELLYCSEWHHTSNRFNRTDFYDFSEDTLEEITEERVSEIIASRAPRQKAEKKIPKEIRAEVTYTVWEGRYRNYRKPRKITEVVTFMEGAKMVETSCGNKRMSSMEQVVIL